MLASIKGAVAAVGLLMASTAAQAAIVHDDGALERPTDTSFSVDFSSPGGTSAFSFDLFGYRSLDGVGNCCEDDFTLNLNGTDILKLSYDLGGDDGAINVVFTNTEGLGIVNHGSVFFGGGSLTISGFIPLVVGLNTLTFGYVSLPPAGFQGLGDEGWGVRNVDVAAVPLPPAALLLLTGLGGLAGMRRMRRAA